MLDFQIKKSTRKCSQTDRDFEPGEVFISALIENDNGSTTRLDYGTDQWGDSPEHCIGWWKSRVPQSNKGKIYWAPRPVMMAFFKHVLDQPASQDVAFVTALLLVQKKYLSLVDDGQAQTMNVRDRNDRLTYAVPVVDIDPTRLAEIQDLLAEQLFLDEPIEADLLEELDES